MPRHAHVDGHLAPSRGALLPLLAVALWGCLGTASPGGSDEANAKASPDDLVVETGALEPFVTGYPPQLAIEGTARAKAGIERVTVSGQTAALNEGRFAASIPSTISTGSELVDVPIRAVDRAGHARKADRSLIVGRFLPEGAIDPAAMTITLGPDFLAELARPLAAEVAKLDVAQQIRALSPLLRSSACTAWPSWGGQQPTRLELGRDDKTGQLRARVIVPNLAAGFSGGCHALFYIGFWGQFSATIEISTTLTPKPAGPDGCVAGFDHSAPDVHVSDWRFSLNGSGFVEGIVIDLFGGSAGNDALEALRSEVTQRAGPLLDAQLAGLRLALSADTSILGAPVATRFCLTALEPTPGGLKAQLGARVTGSAAGLPAPGAPQVDGAVPFDSRASAAWVDANLLSQLLYSAWRAGGLTKPQVAQVEPGLLTALLPSLAGAHPGGGKVDVNVEAKLPPIVHAATPGAGDLQLDLGDLRIELKQGGARLFLFAATVRMTLELEVAGTHLVPRAIRTDAEARLLDSPGATLEDEGLEKLVAAQLGGVAADLLKGVALDLAALVPGLTPTDVVAEPGGRYLKLLLKP